MSRFYWVGIVLFIWSCQPQPPALRIGVAASMYPALRRLQAPYQAQTGQRLELVVHASGKLTAQIEQGLALDLFLSADTLYPTYLYQKGHGAAPPVVYAEGRLVLWLSPNFGTPQGWSSLQTSGIERLAIANPAVAPYGLLAQQALQQAGYAHALSGRLVYGESIAQVNHYISTQSVDAALTAYSSVQDTTLFNPAQLWEVPGVRLPQSMLLLGESPSTEARAFYAFLQGEEAREVLGR